LNTVCGKPLWLVTNNRDSLQAFEQQYIAGVAIKLRADDVSVDITLPSGAKQRREAYYGNGYLSQGSRNFLVPRDTRECVVTNARGEKRSINLRLQNRSRH
jgi:enediyne biosynthesis protein E4